MGYTWVNKGSAIGKTFVYGNTLYQYDSLNNKMVAISTPPRKLDLMFVFRNLQNAVIENNELKVFVNHYNLH